jgi:type II secretory pathway component PulM
MSDAWRDRWAVLAPRERGMLVAGAIVVVGALLYAFLWRPLVDDLPRARADAERAERRLASATASASVAASRAQSPARGPLDASIRGALARHNLSAADATLEVAGARAALTIPSIRFATLVALVDTLARSDAVHVVDATITARVEPGAVRAELTLAR